MNRHPLAAVSVAYLCFILAACGALGVAAPQTFNEKAAAATISVNSASQTVLTLLQARKISPDESDKYIAALEDAQKAIDATRVIYKTDPLDAQNRLASAITALNLLLTELETRK